MSVVEGWSRRSRRAGVHADEQAGTVLRGVILGRRCSLQVRSQGYGAR